MNYSKLKKDIFQMVSASLYLLIFSLNFSIFPAAIPVLDDLPDAVGHELTEDDKLSEDTVLSEEARECKLSEDEVPSSKEGEGEFSEDEDEGDEISSDKIELLKAAKEGKFEVVRELIEKGVDINCARVTDYHQEEMSVEDESRYTPLMLATKYGHFEIVKLLLSQKDIDVNFNIYEGFDDPTFLYNVDAVCIAAFNKQTEILKLILNHKDITIEHVYFLISELVKVKSFDCIELIIDSFGKHVNSIDSGRSHDLTLFIDAANTCDFAAYLIIKALLKNKYLNINIRDSWENATALLIVARHGVAHDVFKGTYALRIVKLLTAHRNIDLNVRDNEGLTALHYFYENKDYNAIQHLFTLQRLNPQIKNRAGFSVIDLAKKDNDARVLKMIDDFYRERQKLADALFTAIKCKNLKLVRWMLPKFTVYVFDENGDTPLQAAIKGEKYEVSNIISRHLSPSISSAVLDYLSDSYEDDLECVRLLLNAVPNLRKLCNRVTKETPLHTALKCKNLKLIKLLLPCTRDLIDVPNNKNQSAMDLAISYPPCLPIFMLNSKKDKSRSVKKTEKLEIDKKEKIVRALINLGLGSIMGGGISSATASGTQNTVSSGSSASISPTPSSITRSSSSSGSMSSTVTSAGPAASSSGLSHDASDTADSSSSTEQDGTVRPTSKKQKTTK